MVDMTIQPEMREVLSKMKGKVFKSYECRYFDWWGYIVSPLRINLGSFAVDIECKYGEVDGWQELDPYDYPTCLICSEADAKSPFFPESNEIEEYLVGARITGIEIVNDYIEINGRPLGSVDEAIVVRTKKSVFTFCRDIWFATTMHLRVGEDVDIPYGVEKCAEDWEEGPDDNTTLPQVIRTRIVL